MTTTEELRQRAKRLWEDPEIKRRILLGQERARENKRLSAPSVSDRFWTKVDKGSTPDDCWLWLGSVNNEGYGSIRVKPKPAGPTLVHRYSYEMLVGPIPDGKELDHRCRNRHCVNPAHLEVVTHSENCGRGDGGLAWSLLQRAKTHCPKGHPYDLFNTYYDKNGGRQCRICKSERARESHLRRHGFSTPRGELVCRPEEEVFRAVGFPYPAPWERD